MSCIHIAGFHCHKVFDKLVSWVKSLFEKPDYHRMELLLERWVSPIDLFGQYLSQDAHELVVDKRDAFQTWFFQSFDLLLHYQFESGRANE